MANEHFDNLRGISIKYNEVSLTDAIEAITADDARFDDLIPFNPETLTYYKSGCTCGKSSCKAPKECGYATNPDDASIAVPMDGVCSCGWFERLSEEADFGLIFATTDGTRYDVGYHAVSRSYATVYHYLSAMYPDDMKELCRDTKFPEPDEVVALLREVLAR